MAYTGPVVAGFQHTNPEVAESGGITLVKPAGVVPGDVLILLASMDGSTTLSWTTPSGWTAGPVSGSSGSQVYTASFWRVADGTEAATQFVGGPWTTLRHVGWYLRVTGASVVDPIGVTSSTLAAVNATSFTAATVTTINDQSLVVSFVAFDGTDGGALGQTQPNWAASMPANQELANPITSNTAGVRAGWLTREMETAGSAGDVTYTATVSDGWAHVAFSINPTVSYLAQFDGRDTVVATGTVPIIGSLAVTDGADSLAATITTSPYPSAMTLRTVSTLNPGEVGVTVGDDATANHTVVSGTVVRTVGADPILTEDYAYRGLYTISPTIAVPGDIADGNDWVVLASLGDFQLRLRREGGTAYQVRADFVTAAVASTFVTGQIRVPNDVTTTIGLGVTRDYVTGAIQLWRSDDRWDTWAPILLATNTLVSGLLPDSAGDSVTLLGGDLSDGPWIAIFRAQWGSTDDITNVDAHEVIAWNYGPNVTGTFTETDVAEWESGASTDLAYTQTSTTTVATSTVVTTLTTNAPTLNTAEAPAGTGSAFTSDVAPTLLEGPNSSVVSPPAQFSSTTQFTMPASTLVWLDAGATARESDGTPQPYRVVVADMFGVEVVALDNAAVGSITWSLNEAESFSFKMPALDPVITQITVADTEVQVWRGEQLIVWGVVVRALVNDSIVDYQCRGLAWYFTKRFIGGPRYNYIVNPSFEGTGSWFYGAAPTELIENTDPSNWEIEVTSERSVAGFPGRSLRLWSNDQMEFGIQAYQFIFHEIDSAVWPDGIKWTASAWVYIPSDEWGFYDAEAEKDIGERNAAYNWGGESAPFGLHLGRFSTTTNEEQNIVAEVYPEVYEISVAGLTDQLPRDQWVRIETSLIQPAPEGGGRRTDWIQVDLHTPLGAVYWDEVSLTRNERLYFNEVDQGAILFSLIEHAQDLDFGKSNLNIFSAASPITFINRTRSYEFFNRELITDAINEFTTLWNGCDWSIETTPTQRLFAPWFPMKGTRRPAQALVLGDNIAAVSMAFDGEQIINRFVVRSDAGGTGSSREEAIGTNASTFPSGLVLESAINAAKESPLDSLEGQLQQALRQKRDATIPTLTTHDGVGAILFGQIVTGDVVPVSVSYGGVVLEGDYRIMSITLNPSDETMDITLNPFDEYNDPSYNLVLEGL